jgi:hypothetical protein
MNTIVVGVEVNSFNCTAFVQILNTKSHLSEEELFHVNDAFRIEVYFIITYISNISF